MRAAQIVAPKRIELIEMPRPDESHDLQADVGRVLVRSQKLTLCGSDHFPYLGIGSPHYPLQPGHSGHEVIGVIERSWNDRWQEGQEVLAQPIGFNGLGDFFLAETASVVLLPPNKPREILPLAQPLGTVLHCLRKFGHWFNACAVVMGQGPMGLLFTAMLRNLGARQIIGIDLYENRLATSRKMGATHTINASQEDPQPLIRDITDGQLADVVVEAVGEEQTFNHCIDYVKPQGHLLAFGVPHQQNYTLDFSKFFRKEIRLIPSVGPEPAIDFPLAMDLIAQDRIDVSPLLSHRLPFSQVQQAFELVTRHKGECLKVLLEF